jgi:hypothetical protein
MRERRAMMAQKAVRRPGWLNRDMDYLRDVRPGAPIQATQKLPTSVNRWGAMAEGTGWLSNPSPETKRLLDRAGSDPH